MFEKTKEKSKDLLGKTNRIIESTIITGNIETLGDFRLDGTLLGNFISQGRLVMGKDAVIKGDVICENADIEGFVEGKIRVSQTLVLKSSANIKGEVLVGQLSVEPGAIFKATCKMMGIEHVEEIENAEKIEEKHKGVEREEKYN